LEVTIIDLEVVKKFLEIVMKFLDLDHVIITTHSEVILIVELEVTLDLELAEVLLVDLEALILESEVIATGSVIAEKAEKDLIAEKAEKDLGVDLEITTQPDSAFQALLETTEETALEAHPQTVYLVIITEDLPLRVTHSLSITNVHPQPGTVSMGYLGLSVNQHKGGQDPPNSIGQVAMVTSSECQLELVSQCSTSLSMIINIYIIIGIVIFVLYKFCKKTEAHLN